MTQTQYFQWLGAPLVNPRWSWGSVRDDGVVFLRAWQDETAKIDGKRYILVVHHAAFVDKPNDLGYQERIRQVDMVRAGARCYIVMVEADPARLPARIIKSYNSDDVFAVGAIRDHGGKEWIELLQRVPATQVRWQPDCVR